MTIAIVLFSIFAVFAFSGAPMMMGAPRPVDGQRPIVMREIFEAPERRAIMVDTDGQAHRTADGTQMTKRDRSRSYRQAPPAPEVQAPPAPIAAAEPEPEPAPVIVEETTVELKPTPVENAAYLTMSQQIEAMLMDDAMLSDSARFTLKAVYREGLVILQGVVADDAEKERLEAKVRAIPGVTAVESHLHMMSDLNQPSAPPAQA